MKFNSFSQKCFAIFCFFLLVSIQVSGQIKITTLNNKVAEDVIIRLKQKALQDIYSLLDIDSLEVFHDSMKRKNLSKVAVQNSLYRIQLFQMQNPTEPNDPFSLVDSMVAVPLFYNESIQLYQRNNLLILETAAKSRFYISYNTLLKKKPNLSRYLTYLNFFKISENLSDETLKMAARKLFRSVTEKTYVSILRRELVLFEDASLTIPLSELNQQQIGWLNKDIFYQATKTYPVEFKNNTSKEFIFPDDLKLLAFSEIKNESGFDLIIKTVYWKMILSNNNKSYSTSAPFKTNDFLIAQSPEVSTFVQMMLESEIIKVFNP
jgi:hypothetical protein